jgi:hypothetical protein
MRDRHPYDKSLGEKMSGLPVPGVNKSWEQMRTLLDQEMPPGRSKRRGGWWFPGALLITLITATSILVTMNLSPQHGDPPLSARAPGDSPGFTNNQILSEKPVTPNDKILLNEKQITSSASTQTNGETPAVGNNLLTNGREAATVINAKRSTQASGMEAADAAGRLPVAYSSAEIPVDAGTQPAMNIVEKNIPFAVPEGPVLFTATGLLVLFDSVDLDKTLAAQYAPVSRKFYRKHRRHHRPPNIREPYTTAGRTFAFGISLPLAFPLGDQKMLGYNISAGPNTVSDYIPAPHVQYHFNSKSYVQTELQVMSPQYIRPVMLHHNEYQTSVSHVSSSVYARKLYYFNVPVSIHYSPFKHFYLGTGLQFSSLLGGVAEHEKIRTGMVSSDSIYQSSYARFGNDSIGSRLRGNEMRLMLDANYYWNRFTVGLRYNQALNNYVSLRPSATASYTLDKNKALQFYMRFNLWEQKKRTPVHQRPLTYR